MWRVLSVFLFLAASQAYSQENASQLEAVITTDLGVIRAEFFPDKAPKHVEQFLKLARQGYYNGSAFHQMVANGIIQGGDPLLKDPKTPRSLWGTGGLNLLPAELSGLKHDRGVISTIRIPDKANSDGAQFFICVTPQPGVDGQYSAFARVTEGIDTVEKISQVPVDAKGLAEKPVRIVSIAIEKKREEPFRGATLDQLRRTVTLKTTLGSIKIRIEPDWAPENARNFLKLVSTGWYNGTAFHRIAKDFVIQGGMPNQRSTGPIHPGDRWIRPIKGEFRGDIKHARGIVSMAHGDDPDSATTSFFFMLANAESLDGKFSAFARVMEGLDVLAAFEKEEVDGETPKRRLEIVEATIDAQ